jgi:FkbM family methyltransferase|tara:strand:+ start:40 stop:720 length:681 start_codon:yes stop_codon:yes gene_type:complete
MNLELTLVNNGKYNVSVIVDDEYIGPTITRGYEWDEWMRHDIKKHYKKDTDILDIGANIGYNSLIFSESGPVVSFEPMFHEILIKNVKQNQLRHPINVYRCALSNEKKSMEMFIPNRGCQSTTQINYGGTSFHMEEDMKGPGIIVPCERLDDIYKGTPSIIKIDVEGHELQVLEGAKETIRKYMPMILVEIHDFTTDNGIHVFLKEMGYMDIPETRPEAMFLYTSA